MISMSQKVVISSEQNVTIVLCNILQSKNVVVVSPTNGMILSPVEKNLDFLLSTVFY